MAQVATATGKGNDLIYSKWQPDTGKYQYFDAPERRGLGDDLPVPRMPFGTAIGVASTSIGRAVPLGARLVGVGDLPRGSIAPTSRAGLSGGIAGMIDVLPTWGWLALGITLGWVLGQRWKG